MRMANPASRRISRGVQIAGAMPAVSTAQRRIPVVDSDEGGRAGGTIPERWSAVLGGLQQGDPGAIVVVTRIVTGFLMRARAYDLHDSWDDVCQDVLLALVQSMKKGGIRDADAFVAYVGAITRNKLADWLRVHRGRRQAAAQPECLADPVALLQDDDMRLDLQDALAALGERQRRVVQALYIDGYSYEAAAERLGVPLGTLKRLQTGALRAVRLRLVIQPRNRRRPVESHAGD